MRKFIFMLLTLIALVGAFSVYFLTQTKFGVSAEYKKTADSFPASDSSSGQLIKAGSGAWSKQFDRDGNLYYQFKCDYYDPQPDGTVKVRQPVIEFFLSGGQVMRIEGKDGIIRFAPGTDKGVLSNSPTEPPRYGSLRTVIVKLYSAADHQSSDDLEMTMTMANAQFDNDTFRLFTEEYVNDAGAVIHANEVPVTVVAHDYSFDGTGMVLYWNDVDKRLKSLEIAHGNDLTLYDAGNLSPGGAAPAAPTPTITNPTAQAVRAGPTVAPLPSEPQQRYTATFYDQVRVLQGGEELVRADRMAIDFAAKSGGSVAAAQSPVPAATTSPSSSGVPVAQTTTAPSPPQPIHVHWSGLVRMLPTDAATAEPLAEGKSIIRLIGSPVKIHEPATSTTDAVDAVCNSLRYGTGDSSAHLSAAVMLKQIPLHGPASTVKGEDLEFSQLTHQARFDGPGETLLPDPHDPKSVLRADWDKRCTVQFYARGTNQAHVEKATLEGNVRVNHPRFQLSAKKDVQLHFDIAGMHDTGEGPASPPLREITAEGDANCVVHEANNQDRRLSGQTLKLIREPDKNGTLYAKHIVCTGAVRATQENENLSADGLTIDLLPSTRASPDTAGGDQLAGDVALDRLVATDNVIVTGKDGSLARGESLEVRMVDDHPHVKLLGSDDGPALVKNKTSTITGWTIQFSPNDQTASIDGPGTFDGVQESKNANEKPRPLKLSWRQDAWLDGKKNLAVMHGGVTASSEDAGARDSAVCDRIVATLADAATTMPSTAPKNPDAIAGGADFMKNKEVKLLSMQMEPGGKQAMADVRSYAQDAGGVLLHQYDLLSRKIDFDPSTKRLNVEGAGRILAVEQSPPAASAPTTQPSSAIGGNGNTAVEWQKRFTYDDAGNTATIEGDITIVHQGNGDKSQSLRLDHADIVKADFYSGGGDRSAAPKLKGMTATGGMVIRTADKTIYCGELDFDPAENILTCRHGQLDKVTIVDDNNISGGTCSEATFNLKTNELKKMTNVTGEGK